MIIAIISLSLLSLWAFTERQNSVKSTKVALAEKQTAQEQKKIAENQKGIAEKNLIHANAQEARALGEQAEADRQKNIAILRAEETRLQKLKAERATVEANDARKAAELDRQIAESQRKISDELRVKAEQSQKNATRLRILSIAQAMAINSRFRSSADTLDDVTLLMAMQAYKFNLKYGGDPNDPGIYDALFTSLFNHKELAGEHILKSHTDIVNGVLFDSEDYNFISCGDDGSLIFHRLFHPEKATTVSNTGLIVNNICMSRDRKKVAYSADNNKVFVIEMGNLQAKPTIIPVAHEGKITSVIWTGSGIITASLDNSLRLINPVSNTLISSRKLLKRPLSLAWNEKQNILAIGFDDGSIMLQKPDLNSEPAMFAKTGLAQIKCLDFNSTGSKLAFGTGDAICGTYQVNNPSAAPILYKGHNAAVSFIKFNPVSDQMASASLDGKVILWRTDQPESSRIVIGNSESWILGLGFSADGKYLAYGGKDKNIRFIGSEAEFVYDELKAVLTRDFTQAEWQKYVGSDIPYETTTE
jgi:hypothetical protein